MPEQISKYRIVGSLGQGAMGIVYRAWDPDLQRDVAIKLLKGLTTDDESLLERFYQEARAIARLTHRSIVSIYDLGHENGVPFLVMEYVPGRSLDEAIRSRAPYSVREKLAVIEAMCQALDYAHSNGIVHRDVKPGNIRLTEGGGAKLLDFGIAKLAGATLTGSREILGTPAYLPPEAVEGGAVDARSDVFSLGATLYEWLAYRPPFQAQTISAVLWQILHDDPPSLHELTSGACPPALAHVVEKALAKTPDGRYQSAAEMLADLESVTRRLLDVEDRAPRPAPVAAREIEPPPGSLQSSRRTSAARSLLRVAPVRVRLSVLALAILACGLAYFMWGPGLADRARPPDVAGSIVVERPPSAGPTTGRAPDSPVAAGSTGSARIPPPSTSESGRRGASGTTPAAVENAPVSDATPAEDAPVIVPVGTKLFVRIVDELRTDRNRAGDAFEAVLEEPLIHEARLIAPAHSPIRGRVDHIGVTSGSSQLFFELSLTDIRIHERITPIRTGVYRALGPSPGEAGLLALVIGAAVGAGVGATLGGAREAAAGVSAGARAVESAGGPSSREIVLGNRLTFKLAEPLVVPVPKS